MKTFSLKASLIAGLSHTISQLSPKEKGIVNEADPVKANSTTIHLVEDLEAANKVFMDATKSTSEKLTAAFEGFKKELDAEAEGKTDEEKQKIASQKTNLYRKEAEKIQAESTAQPDVVVEVSLSDEKLEAAKKLFPLTVGQWNDSKMFVEVAESMEKAVDAV